MSHLYNLITDLKAWLEKHDCSYVRPVRAFFETPRLDTTEHRDGCLYRRTLRYTEGMTAVTRGDAKAGNTYVESSCYLLGDRPIAVLPGAPRHTKACFQAGIQDWYVACWIEAKSITPRIAEYHPFGPSFIMKPWLLDEKIDAHERHPRYRDRHVPYTRYSINFDLDALHG